MRLDLYAEGGYSGGGITENGGNISGPLLLAGNPSQTLEAVPKQYVDAYYNSINAGNLVAGTLPAARLPNFTGDLQSSPGTTQLTLNNSGVSAGEYSKVTVNSKGIVTGGSNIGDSDIPFGINWSKINQGTLPSSLSGYGITNGVSISGATMLGFLTISNEPTLGNHIATKQYVDSLVSGGGIAVGDILRKPYSTTPTGFLKCNGAEVDKTTYANLYSVIGDSYVKNTIIGNGQPWRQQYQINETQAGEMTGWIAETSLPIAIASGQVFVTKNRVYILGGYNGGSYLSAVYTAPINADGTLGTWVAGTALPVFCYGPQVIVTKNRVYLLGGFNGTAWTNLVYTAVINSDGTIGTWTAGTALPGVSGWAQAIITKNRVYLIGGLIDSNVPLSTVYTAPINSDGTLGAWTTGTSLPIAIGYSSSAVIKNKIYLFGGFVSNQTPISTVLTANINSDGTITSWNEIASLPISTSGGQVYVTKNRVYLIGGWNGNTAGAHSVCLSCVINSDATLGNWVFSESLPITLTSSHIIATKNRVYMLGGYTGTGTIVSNVYSVTINGGLNDYSEFYSADTTNYLMPGSGRPWQQQYEINTTQVNDITGWGSGPTMPGTLVYSSSIVTKNRVYILGGFNGSGNVSTVYTAPINSDGTLGSWTTGTALPLTLSQSQVIVTKNRAYILGGTDGSANQSGIYTAVINSDGTLGAWSSSGSLPAAVSASQAFITKNRVYLCGGYNGASGVSNIVYTAPIDTDGLIGTWSTSSTLPSALGYAPAVVTKNRVYLLGGYTAANSYTANIYTATINSDGILGPWTTWGALPGVQVLGQAITTKNRAYLISGHNGSAYVSRIYTAPINEDGTLGTWTTGTSMTGALGMCQAAITKNRLYVIGGFTGGAWSGLVYTAPINGGTNDYTNYYDGSILPAVIVNNTNKFLLPDLSADEPFGSYSYIKY